MRLRHILLWLIVVLSVFFACPSLCAPEAPLTVIAVMTPTDYVEIGNGTLMITLINRSELNVTGVSLSPGKGQAGDMIGDIEPGASSYYAYPVEVTEKLLEAGSADVYISYKAGNQNYKEQTSAVVRKVSALPKAELTVRIESDVLHEGDDQLIVYTASNTGDVEIKNAQISDSLGSYTSGIFELAPGETKTVSQLLTVESKYESEARMTFLSALSGTAYDVTAGKKAFDIARDDVVITPGSGTHDISYGERAYFTLTIENRGAFRYTDLHLVSPLLGSLSPLPDTLNPGETVSADISTPPMTENAQISFTLALRDETGTLISIESPGVMVNVRPLPESEPVMYASAGGRDDCEFTVFIQGGSKNIVNARLSEGKLSYARTLAVIPAGRETAVYVDAEPEKDGEYKFLLTWDEDGVSKSISASPVRYVGGISSDKAAGDVRNALDAIVHLKNLPLIVIIVCVSIIAGYIAFLLVRGVRKEKLKRKKRMDDMSKTSKFAPVRIRDQEKENQ